MHRTAFPQSGVLTCEAARPAPAARCGFTLIELLMVISIIALLIAILMPALGGARKQANQTACGSTMKGLGTAMAVYLSEFDGSYPLNGVIIPKPGGNNTAPNIGFGNGETNMQKWDLPYGVLWPEVNMNRKAYLCNQDVKDGLYRNGVPANSGQLPLQRDPNTGVISVGPGPNGYWSYSVNSVLNSEGQFRRHFYPRDTTATTQQPWIDPIKWSNISRTADFIVFVEEDVNSPFNDEVFDAPAYNGGDKLTNRHKNGGNVCFADGHVEPFSDVVFNNGISAGSGPNTDHWSAMQYPITREFFPDGGTFATPP